MIQETDDIKRMIRWAVDTDGVRFAKQIYNREEPDEYTRDKFYGMQNNFINWIANLDNRNQERLRSAINKSHPTNEWWAEEKK